MERLTSNSPVAQKVKSEIASLILEGCVLSTKELDEIAAYHGVRSGIFIMNRLYRIFGTRIGSSQNHQADYYNIAGALITKTTYKRHILIVSSSLPLDQTAWEEVTANIDAKLHRASIISGQSRRASGKPFSRPRGPFTSRW